MKKNKQSCISQFSFLIVALIVYTTTDADALQGFNEVHIETVLRQLEKNILFKLFLVNSYINLFYFTETKCLRSEQPAEIISFSVHI